MPTAILMAKPAERFHQMTIDTSDDAIHTARVVSHHRDGYVVRLPWGDTSARLPGRFRHVAASPEALPAVGDWVTVSTTAADPKLAIIREVHPRRSAFVRKVALGVTAPQVVAANVDLAFITAALPNDVNHRRIERYLTLAWESGATPVVLLTKADLVDDPDSCVHDVREVAPGVDVLAASAVSGTGMDAVMARLTRDVTAVLLGSSGAGKSTLVNALTGEDRQRTAALRNDGGGRHTTTHRELIDLESGASIIDTPGMRELQLWSSPEGLGETFHDIMTLAAECRFRDCVHRTEPGCAVLTAIDQGMLDQGRLDSWRKLAREVEYLEQRKDAAAHAAARAYARSMQHLLRGRLCEKYGKPRS
jgi:ribosome biogenesis GTPase